MDQFPGLPGPSAGGGRPGGGSGAGLRGGPQHGLKRPGHRGTGGRAGVLHFPGGRLGAEKGHDGGRKLPGRERDGAGQHGRGRGGVRGQDHRGAGPGDLQHRGDHTGAGHGPDDSDHRPLRLLFQRISGRQRGGGYDVWDRQGTVKERLQAKVQSGFLRHGRGGVGGGKLQVRLVHGRLRGGVHRSSRVERKDLRQL